MKSDISEVVTRSILIPVEAHLNVQGISHANKAIHDLTREVENATDRLNELYRKFGTVEAKTDELFAKFDEMLDDIEIVLRKVTKAGKK